MTKGDERQQIPYPIDWKVTVEARVVWSSKNLGLESSLRLNDLRLVMLKQELGLPETWRSLIERKWPLSLPLLSEQCWSTAVCYESLERAKRAAFTLVKVIAAFDGIPWTECPGWIQKRAENSPMLLVMHQSDVDQVVAWVGPSEEHCIADYKVNHRPGIKWETARWAVESLSHDCKQILSHPDFGAL